MNTLVSVTPSLFAAVLVAGCAYPNQFRNIRADSPYAVLVGEDVTLFHINGQPTSFWRFRERFFVAPGPTTVRVISGCLSSQSCGSRLRRDRPIPASGSVAVVPTPSFSGTAAGEWLWSRSGG